MYGRDGRDNILLPTGSPRFKEAFEYTKAVLLDKVSLRDLKIGQKVEILSEGKRREVIYIGRRTEIRHRHNWYEKVDSNALHPAAQKYNSSEGYYRDVYTDTLCKPRHMFLDPKPTPIPNVHPSGWYRGFYNPASPVVTRIIEHDAMTPEEVEKMVEEWQGPMLRPHEPSDYEKKRGYRTKPDSILLHTLDHAKAKEIYEERKVLLDNWVGIDIPPEGP